MKLGLAVGDTAEIQAVVSEDMFARFEGQLVHPAYSTVSMVYHMEWAARQLILPYLEAGEEGVGGAVSLKHLGMAAEGTRLIVTATVTAMTSRRVDASIEVRDGQTIIGTGEVTQFILEKSRIQEKLQNNVPTK
ncbi:thioesterase [Exiguobacterium sp. Leaf187]|uniref:Thioesterase n=1 Tax=Exiguobacterium indicum TaxID=296995 RepID=A0ABU8EJ68_9BACL|nr:MULTISPECIES: thioesterase [unclassified Exiguobacterium]AHA28702.1 thioesterase [Exiguobacterium sp. MH3]KOP30836.1 thioesterase [Exiguobacterium sp. BMC-KP]KQS15446.1 thioesterase [Exiguobacterium sp. Leaf187]